MSYCNPFCLHIEQELLIIDSENSRKEVIEMKNGVKVLILVVLVFAVGFAIWWSDDNSTSKQLDRNLANIDMKLTDEEKQAIDRGIKIGTDLADRDFDMQRKTPGN